MEKGTHGFAGPMLAGIAPRSASAAKVHRLFRDGHASEAEFRAALEGDSRELLAEQEGFAFVSAGQLDWLDLFRPLTSCFSGFSKRASAGDDAVGPVTRWFRTNTFYRKPLVGGKIGRAGAGLAAVLPALGRDSVVIVPGPYSFARMVEDSFYGDEGKLAMDYAMALAASSKELAGMGYRCMLLSEPAVGFEQSVGDFKAPGWFQKAISAAKTEGIVLGVNFPLAEACDTVPLADGSKVDFIGIDTVFSSSFGIRTDKDVLLGVVDSASVRVEDAKVIGSRVREFVSEAKFPGRYYTGTTDRLYDVPFDFALGKIGALAAFRGV